MPRLFVALEVPDQTSEALAPLRGGIPFARWIEPDDHHVTLRFLGDVDRRTAEAAAETLAEVRRAAFSLQFEGLDWFGGEKPRALIARVRPEAALTDLQAEIERRMRRIGLKAETQNYSPHVTVARLRGVSEALAVDWVASRAGVPLVGFLSSHFSLYSARDCVGGGPYIVEAEYPLQRSSELVR